MLKQRVITAAVLLLVFVSVVFFLPKVFFTLFVAMVALLGAWEWSRLAGLQDSIQRWSFAGFTGVVTLLLLLLESHAFVERWSSLLALLFWLTAFLTLVHKPTRQASTAVDLSLLGAGVFAMSSTAIAMQALHHTAAFGSSWLLMYALGVVWVMDIGAYFSGKKFGRSKLAPLISPGKTREGVYGGIAAAVLLMCIALIVSSELRESAGRLFAATTIAAIFSVVGDLFESRLKRAAKLKDSSQLLPGHGGVLDRIDGVIAALPLFLCVWVWN